MARGSGAPTFLSSECSTLTSVKQEPSLFDFLSEDCSGDDAIHDPGSSQSETEAVELSYDIALVEIRRSKRRKKSSSAHRENGKIIISVPWRMSKAEIAETVDELLVRLQKVERHKVDPEALYARAQLLVDQFLDSDVLGNHAVPVTIRWVTNQNTRWGSCTPATGTIRLSHRLRSMPQYVQDAVLLHELIHLIVIHHNDEFHAYMNRYPELVRAQAFLSGYALARYEQ